MSLKRARQQSSPEDGSEEDRYELPEALVSGREKRATAGNRLRALLDQELDKEEMFEEIENDEEFEEAADEIDVVDSDFDQSSDDGQAAVEGAGADDQAEQDIREEEKAAKKAGRIRALPAHMRNPGVPFHTAAKKRALAVAASSASSSGRAVGQVSSSSGASPSASASETPLNVRQSSRHATVLNKKQLEATIAAEEARKAKLSARPQAPKPQRQIMTQDMYIAEALETEEANRESLRMFLEREEERKAKARMSKKEEIDGPYLRWRSVRIERALPKPPAIVQLEADNSESIVQSHDAAGEQAKNLQEKEVSPPPISTQGVSVSAVESQEDLVPSGSAPIPNLSQTATDRGTESAPAETQASDANLQATVHSSSSQSVPSMLQRAAQLTADPVLAARAEAQARRLLQQEQFRAKHLARSTALSESRTHVSLHGLPEGSTWIDEFTALLGDHAAWDELSLVPARNRPLRPRQSTCVITGLPAVYKDPRTGIPFATAEAYGVLSGLLDNRYDWTGSQNTERTGPLGMGIYLGLAGEEGAGGVIGKARSRADVLIRERAATIVPASERRSKANASVGLPKQHARKSSGPVNSTVAKTHRTPSASTTTKPGREELDRATLVSTETSSPEVKPAAPVAQVGPPGVAPGDERALMAAAGQIGAGTTRSGARRAAR